MIHLMIVEWGAVVTTAIISFASAALSWILAYSIFKVRVQAKFDQYDEDRLRTQQQFKGIYDAVDKRITSLKQDTEDKIQMCNIRITEYDTEMKKTIRENAKVNERNQNEMTTTLKEISQMLSETSEKVAYMAGKLDNHIDNAISTKK